ncbi:low affinity iron permease family protein [Candidatus Microgenomates bacterium]|nr:low affinity iron permease family protein [Candidatus Microgenomates bacterium]
MNEFFHKVAAKISSKMGSPWSFLLALLVVVVWALTGPLFNFSDTWQLVINTGTTVVTFLMVFLIQNTQNRDAKAMQLKLDELIRSNSGARDDLIDLENLSDAEIQALDEMFRQLHEEKGHDLAFKLAEKIKSEKVRRGLHLFGK